MVGVDHTSCSARTAGAAKGVCVCGVGCVILANVLWCVCVCEVERARARRGIGVHMSLSVLTVFSHYHSILTIFSQYSLQYSLSILLQNMGIRAHGPARKKFF